MSNLEKYKQAFCSSLGIDESQLVGLNFHDVPTWDSIGHMTLVAAIEDAFDIMMEMDDIIDLSSFEKGQEILHNKYNVAI